jgi:hypothetical protein
MPPKSSRFRGVTLFKPTGKWRAQISAGARAFRCFAAARVRRFLSPKRGAAPLRVAPPALAHR